MGENINTLDVRETEQVVDTTGEDTANIQTITTEDVETATADSEAPEETETQTETEDIGDEYDWETDINTKVQNIENTLETLTSRLNQAVESLNTLLDDKQKRDKKLSGFFKPVENGRQLKDDGAITYDDLYTYTRK